MNALSFDVGPDGQGRTAIVPCIDGISLILRVTSYEAARNYDVVGGYGGLISAYFNYGLLDRYFFEGWDKSQSGNARWVWVLGCQCGEVGCWPLECIVEARDGVVIWRDFVQPHRRNLVQSHSRARDYGEFGPFVFDDTAYRHALATLPKL